MDRPPGSQVYVYFTSRRKIECVTPSYVGATRLQALSLGPRPSAECRYCDSLHVDAFHYPLLVQLEDVALVRDRIPRRESLTLQVNAFSQQLEVFSDEKDFAKKQEERRIQPSVAPESVIPTGFLSSSRPQPQMMMTGRVIESAIRKNCLSGKPYVWARVQTLGTQVDVLASYREVPDGLSPGQIVQGEFWLVGRVVDGLLPPPKPGWISKSTRRIT